MIDHKTLRDALGWGCIGLASVVVGSILQANGRHLGAAAVTIGGTVIVPCLAVLAYEFLRRD